MPTSGGPSRDATVHFQIESYDPGIICTTPDGVVTAWDGGAERLFHTSAREILGKSFSLFIAPSQPLSFSEFVQTVSRVATRTQARALRRTDGTLIDTILTVSFIQDAGNGTAGILLIVRKAREIERRKQAERDQLFLSSIVSSAQDAIISKDIDGIVTSWNEAAERMFGYTAAEMIGKPVALLIPDDHFDEEPHILQRVRQGNRVEAYETKRRRKDGSLLDVMLTISPIKDFSGTVIGASKIVRDITEIRRLEKAEGDQSFLSSIISSAEDGIISKNLDGIITSWNKAAERIFGYTAEEIIGKPVTLLIPADHPNEEPQILARIRRGERIEHYETQRLRKDKTLLDVSLTVSPIRDRMGRVIGASKIVRDISERQRWQKAEAAESFLGALVASAEDAIISKTLDGIVTSWNPAAEKLYGYTAEEMIGKPVAILVPSDHPDEEPQILQRIRRGERIDHYETKRRCKDGSRIDVALTVSPIRDGLGRIIGASKIARDITEQKQAVIRERDALRQATEARRAAEQANRTKDEFLATVSHELRTPMTAIVGWSRLLTSGQLPADLYPKAFDVIDRNARAQAQLIEDLLDVSRIISGKLRVEFSPVDLASVIAAAVEAVRQSAEVKGVRIRTLLSSDVAPILGDFQRLQQVIWNLLSNAIRFTNRGGTVQIELQRIESQIDLRVVDTGIGIKPEFLPRIFDRFTQADSSLTRTAGGLGMGLAIVKSLVELHGGVVTASSAGEGQGSIFTVKLPMTAVRYTEKPATTPPTATANLERSELVGLKILVVDDEPDSCGLIKFVFNKAGAIVETANNAENALRLLDHWHPDLLISDIGMPGLDGYEFIRIVREDRQCRIPAVALTALARIDDRVKALSSGYQMHVSKPVEPSELLSIVASLVGLINRDPAI